MRKRILVLCLLLITLAILIWGFLSFYLTSQISKSLPSAEAQIQQSYLRRSISLTLLLTFLVFIPLVVWVSDRAVQPLRRVIHQASLVIQDHLTDSAITVKMTDDLHLLRRYLNILVDQLHTFQTLSATESGRYHALLEATNDAMILVDEQGLVQTINTAAERLFSLRREYVQGRSLAESLRHHQIVELWRNCQRMGRAQTAMIETSAPRLYLQASAHLISPHPPFETLLVFQNLTRQRYLETVRRDFVSNLSHELRTPLASLKALTETLQEGALEEPQTARHFLKRMEAEVDALTQMVAELLELSRIESGKVSLQMEPISPLEVLLPAVNRMHVQVERAGLKLETDYPESLPLILADAPRLETVIVNLLHNAIKFTPAGGMIQVGVKRVEEEDHHAVIFSFRDTGVGISAEDLPRIFERFYKADRARASSGTGLGLAIARHIVEAHGGKIWAESTQGQGSTFYFTIPLSKSQPLSP